MTDQKFKTVEVKAPWITKTNGTLNIQDVIQMVKHKSNIQYKQCFTAEHDKTIFKVWNTLSTFIKNKCWPKRTSTSATSVHSHSTLLPRTHHLSKTTLAPTEKNSDESIKQIIARDHVSLLAINSSNVYLGNRGKKRLLNQDRSTRYTNKVTMQSTATSNQ